MKKLLLAMSMVVLLQPNLFGMDVPRHSEEAIRAAKTARVSVDIAEVQLPRFGNAMARDTILTYIGTIPDEKDRRILKAHFDKLKEAYDSNKSKEELAFITNDFSDNVRKLRLKSINQPHSQLTMPRPTPVFKTQPETPSVAPFVRPAPVDKSTAEFAEKKLRGSMLQLLGSPSSNIEKIKNIVDQLAEEKEILKSDYKNLEAAIKSNDKAGIDKAAREFRKNITRLQLQ